MKRYSTVALAGLLCVNVTMGKAQNSLPVSGIIPGTEKVQLVYNGDFQFQGPAVTNAHPTPVAWTRGADMFVGPGKNMVKANNGVVAQALVNGKATVCYYQRTINLSPKTEYVLSAYMWNMGDADNNVIAVIDLNDAPEEPQVTLNYTDEDADQGYFVYNSFNTAKTGTNVALRIFYESPVGKGAAVKYFPIGAQWGNLAITKASEFQPPQSTGGAANLRPMVSITSPADGDDLDVTNTPATLPVTVSASDADGKVTKVEVFAGAKKVGQATTSPYTVVWSKPASGYYQLTAVATDDKKATTVSAPVNISVVALKTAKAKVKAK